MNHYIKYKNQYYILANSPLADDRTLVLKHGDSFGVFDRYGNIHSVGQGIQGLYHHDTRFLSKMELLVDGERPLLLSSGLKEGNELLTADLSNPDLVKDNKIIERGTLHIHRTKFILNEVVYEMIRLCNFGIEPLSFELEFNFAADYKDIFELRGIERAKSGKKTKNKADDSEVGLGYIGLDQIKRKTKLKFEPEPSLSSAHSVIYQITLLPKACDYISLAIAFEMNGNKPEVLDYDDAYQRLLSYLNKVNNTACEIMTSSDQLNEWLNRSKSDLSVMVTKTEHGWYPYAGIPWYSSPFGRDGIITAWEMLWINPHIARGVLKYLASVQAKEFNKSKDEQPGKILHENRTGEMANTGETPFKMYYGSIDATPLFVGLAGAYYERTGDLDLITGIWPNIEKALEWIDKYGDIDGDGFVEYEKKSEKGLVNQGWKDSHDSVFYEDGSLAKGPIALCEVQGYVYDAKIKAAKLARELGYFQKAEEQVNQAEELKEKFIKAFWSESKNTFAMALDGEKRQCNVNTSNAGHCLFSGIVPVNLAESLVTTLFNDKMFSGWGIRTVAMDEARYNPMSYHNGSVWPHENAMIAYGLGQYGYQEETLKIMEALFEASSYVDAQRLPELFCGFEKRKNEGPTRYPVACSPQAWSIGSVYMLIQACLGIRIIANENMIYFYNPQLPDFLEELTITNLKVNDSTFILQLRKTFTELKIDVLHKEGNANIKIIYDEMPLYKMEEKIRVGYLK